MIAVERIENGELVIAQKCPLALDVSNSTYRLIATWSFDFI
jgi:hypothetical protein